MLIDVERLISNFSSNFKSCMHAFLYHECLLVEIARKLFNW
jgi:hypothetical protein